MFKRSIIVLKHLEFNVFNCPYVHWSNLASKLIRRNNLFKDTYFLKSSTCAGYSRQSTHDRKRWRWNNYKLYRHNPNFIMSVSLVFSVYMQKPYPSWNAECVINIGVIGEYFLFWKKNVNYSKLISKKRIKRRITILGNAKSLLLN
jgi:hypothetical protein